MGNSGERAILCPRCGYDQRGIIASWRDICPLQATCTECGLTYSCAETIMPHKFEPKWCVEYCRPRPMCFLRSCAATCARSFVSWRFWSRLRMSDPIQPKRIAFYVILLMVAALAVPLIASPVVQQGAAAVSTWNVVHGQIALDIHRRQRQMDDVRALPLIPLYILQQYPEEERERALAGAARDRETYLANLQAQIDNPPVVKHSLVLAVFEAIFLPLAQTSFGTIRHRDGMVIAYPAPFELWKRPALSQSPWSLAPAMFPAGANTRNGLIIGVLTYLAFPLTLALLPVSRRKAKVRWAHIWRAAAYGVIIPLCAIVISVIILMIVWTRLGGAWSVAAHVVVSMWFIPVGMIIWWTFAISRYMKIPHAIWIALIHTYFAVMLVLAMAWLFYQPLLFGY